MAPTRRSASTTPTGALLRTYTFPTTGFINDLVITRKGVYATDSVNQQLAVVPFRNWSHRSRHAWGKLPAVDKAKVMPLSGDIAYQAGFNANGIVAKSGWLILVQSNTGPAVPRQPADRRRQGDRHRRLQRHATATGSCSAAGGCTSCATRTTWSRC